MKKNMTNGTIEFSDTDMYYVSFGSGKRNLIVLPGLSDGLATVKGKAWLLHFPYRRYLKDYKVYIFSRKNKMPENYTIRQMADDQVLAMKKLGLNKANILGVSQGGMIAQYIAINHPETVDKLILAVKRYVLFPANPLTSLQVQFDNCHNENRTCACNLQTSCQFHLYLSEPES